MSSLFIDLIPVGVMQGLILSLIALGIFIPFRILNFPDLTAEGSYPLGGIMCASLLAGDVNPILATVLAAFCAGCLGIGTALVHITLKVNTLLAGIILTTMAYSIDLRLMGKPNLALFDTMTIFSYIGENPIVKDMVILSVIGIVTLLLYCFLKTEKGLRFRAVGFNPLFSKHQGIKLPSYILLGLFTGNALCGLAGSLMVQVQEYADVGMGVGIVIHALAALMIGESLIKTKTILSQLMAPFVGALIYQQIQGMALAIGLEPSDLKLFTGCIVLGVIAFRRRVHNEQFLS